MMTKDEFKKELWHYGQEQRSISGTREQRARIGNQAGVARKALLDAYDEMAKRIAELEAACERALEGLRAPTHAANDHNCEDWPPGQGCRGCDGNELRKAVAGEIAALLRGEG